MIEHNPRAGASFQPPPKPPAIKRGDVFWADLSPVVGNEFGGVHPVVVLQNDIGNKYSPTVIVAAMTSNVSKANRHTRIAVTYDDGLKDSVILLDQIRTLDKKRLRGTMTHLDETVMKTVDRALKLLLALED